MDFLNYGFEFKLNILLMIDSHAHLADKQFDGDRQQVIEQAQKQNIQWIEIGTNITSSCRAIKLAEEHQDAILGATVGVHPDHVFSLTEPNWLEIESLLQQDRVIAIGEIGLDYYRGGSFNEQLPSLRRFTELAVSKNLPIVFHVRSGISNPPAKPRTAGDKGGEGLPAVAPPAGGAKAGGFIDAHQDLINFLASLPANERPVGVSHSFSGTVQQARQYIKLGLYVGISGVITFKNAGQLTQVAKEISLDKILIETDSPYLSPAPHRGQRNDPTRVRYVTEKIAVLKGISTQEVEQVTANNAKTLFKI